MSSGLRAGYKQTEVGVIPEDWDVAALGEVAATSSGTTPARDLADRYYRNGTVHWVKTLDLNNSELSDTDEQVTETAVDETSLRPYPIGTVLVAMYGGFNQIGRTGLIRMPAAVNQAITAIQPQATKLHPEFLLATLNFRVGYWKTVASSSRKDPNITSHDVRAFPISLPPLPEQRAIAAALSDADALLGGLDSLIAKKQGLKVAAMQQLLTGQTRLPGFSGEWELRPLASAIAGLEAGISVNSVEHGKPLGSGEPCILKTSAIFDGCFDPEECKLIDRRDISRAKLSPRRNTIIISRMNTPNLVGEVGYVHDDFPTLNLPDRLWMTRFDPNSDISARWLAYVLSSPQIKENIKGLASGTSGSMKNIGKGKLLALQLEFPTGKEQTAIAAILADMDTELAALQARRSKTQAIKQAMMQELLTGRIRLV